jgi:hypothetical protein
VKQLEAFLGLFNFYRRFVPAAAAIVKPLTDAFRGDPAGAKPVSWTAEMRAAFIGHQGGTGHRRAAGPPGGGSGAGLGDRRFRVAFGRGSSAEAAGQLVAAAGFLFQEAV